MEEREDGGESKRGEVAFALLLRAYGTFNIVGVNLHSTNIASLAGLAFCIK